MDVCRHGIIAARICVLRTKVATYIISVIAAPVSDYVAVRAKANSILLAKAKLVQKYVSKLQTAQRAAEEALDM